jgi:hypothetical protein
MIKQNIHMFKNPVLMIGFVSIIYVMHFLFFHGGYFGYDDMEYCKLAGSLTQGHWVHDSQYAFRYGIVFPLAASYVIFGIHDFANFLTGFSPLILTFVMVVGDDQGPFTNVPMDGCNVPVPVTNTSDVC